jgi:hypothetical protein
MYTPSLFLFERLFQNLIFIIIITITLISCDSGEPKPNEEIDRGSYNMEVYPSNSLKSYADGGGCFILRLSPNFDFSGKVRLSIETDPKLNAKLSYNYTSKEYIISEISFHASSIIDTGVYPLIIHMNHNNIQDKCCLSVNIVKFVFEPFSWLQEYDNFALYIGKYHSQYTLGSQDTWFKYMNEIPPMCGIKIILLDDRYEINYTVTCASKPIYFKLRRRNIEISPSLILTMERDGSIYRE